MKSFSSKNLLMRPLDAQDEAMFCALYTDEKSMRFIEPAFSQEKAKKAFNSFVKGNVNSNSGFSTWAIVSKNNSVSTVAQQDVTFQKTTDTITVHQNITPLLTTVPAIGFVVLYNKAGKLPLKITEIGIMLLGQARGKRLAEEAFGALLSYGFKQLKLPYINVRFDIRNLAIRRITKNIGFSYHQDFTDEVLLNKPKNIFNNSKTCLETISLSQWRNHTLQYEIELKLS